MDKVSQLVGYYTILGLAVVKGWSVKVYMTQVLC